MSYDLQVWSVKPFRQDAIRQPETWQKEPGAWTHARRAWQIVVSASDRVVLEDVPSEVSKLLPGIEWLTNLSLEGKATTEALRLVQSIATDIARFGHGVVLDQQDGSIRLPSGVKRLMAPRSKEMFDVLSLSWWFLDSPIESREGREHFICLLERILPEALPKRYGSHEPPQHVYAQAGKEHFLAFLDQNPNDTKVWYPHRPVVSVHLSLPSSLGAHHLGFRTNHLVIEVEKDALLEPGWTTNIKQFWQQASVLINPIYGDVRILGKYRWVGATVSPGQEHPVITWWWAGIPEKLGNAVVLGDLYQKLWPAFTKTSSMINGLAFASLEDWSTIGDLVDKVGRPPHEQVQIPDRFGSVMNAEIYREYLAEVRRLGPHNVRRKYPLGWPFGEPFAP